MITNSSVVVSRLLSEGTVVPNSEGKFRKEISRREIAKHADIYNATLDLAIS